MAEERDEVRREESQPRPVGPADRDRIVEHRDPAVPPPGHETRRELRPGERGQKSPAELEHEIERTRAQMSETIDEIGERLSPRYIKEQVKQEVKETARGVSTTMLDTIKQNPIPSVIAGLSIGWLIKKASEDSGRRAPSRMGSRTSVYRGQPVYREPYGYAGTAYPYESTERETSSRSSATERAGQMAGQAREEMKDMGREAQHRAREFGREAQHRAQEFGEEVQHRAQEFGQQVQHQASRTADRLEDVMRENPFASGLIVLAAGAAVGLALPKTHMEDEVMGEARDTVVRKAEETARDTMKKVERVAERTAQEAQDEVKASAERIKETAKEEAKRQGLSQGQQSQQQGQKGGQSS